MLALSQRPYVQEIYGDDETSDETVLSSSNRSRAHYISSAEESRLNMHYFLRKIGFLKAQAEIIVISVPSEKIILV